MSATVAGAMKAAVEATGLGLAAYRDRAPAGAALPYVVITEGIGRTSERCGDFGDPDAVMEVRELVQVDLLQASIDPASGARLERYGLPQALAARLHGRALPPVLDGACYPVRVVGATRVPPAPSGVTENLVRDTLTVKVLREVPLTVIAP